MEIFTFTVAVGWTSSRPVRPDEHVTTLTFEAKDDREALRTADSWVSSRPPRFPFAAHEMTTSFSILSVEV